MGISVIGVAAMLDRDYDTHFAVRATGAAAGALAAAAGFFVSVGIGIAAVLVLAGVIAF